MVVAFTVVFTVASTLAFTVSLAISVGLSVGLFLVMAGFLTRPAVAVVVLTLGSMVVMARAALLAVVLLMFLVLMVWLLMVWLLMVWMVVVVVGWSGDFAWNEVHTAFRASSAFLLDDLGVHGAGVLDARGEERGVEVSNVLREGLSAQQAAYSP